MFCLSLLAGCCIWDPCPATATSLCPATATSLCPATATFLCPATATSLYPATVTSLCPATVTSLCPATVTSLCPAKLRSRDRNGATHPPAGGPNALQSRVGPAQPRHFGARRCPAAATSHEGKPLLTVRAMVVFTAALRWGDHRALRPAWIVTSPAGLAMLRIWLGRERACPVCDGSMAAAHAPAAKTSTAHEKHRPRRRPVCVTGGADWCKPPHRHRRRLVEAAAQTAFSCGRWWNVI